MFIQQTFIHGRHTIILFRNQCNLKHNIPLKFFKKKKEIKILNWIKIYMISSYLLSAKHIFKSIRGKYTRADHIYIYIYIKSWTLIKKRRRRRRFEHLNYIDTLSRSSKKTPFFNYITPQCQKHPFSMAFNLR